MSEKSPATTLEEALFGRMGLSVEDAIATGADVLDQRIGAAAQAGDPVDQRINGLADLLGKLTEPQTLQALQTLLECLPQLAQLARLAQQLPNVLATAGDVLDDYQRQCDQQGIDIEKAMINSLHAAMFLGSRVDKQHLQRIGDLLASDILNPHAVNVVDNAARSLTTAQENVCATESPQRVGLLGLLSALRDPQIQRSLAFAIQFGRCFGRNLDNRGSATKS